MKNKNTQVFALGGLGEVGKNMYCIRHNDEIIIVDAGVMFPDDDLLGIDYVIPDFTYLIENEKKIKYLLITHGHEDHIGGIPFLLQQVNIPKIYAPAQAKELIEKKLTERNIKYKNLKVYTEDTILKTKYFNIEFFRTTHSIPDSHGISITTPNGVVVMTGDFKFDFTPVGPMSNLQKMAEIGKRGVKLLMSDSTNALSPGISLSESTVDENLGEIFRNNKDNRIILATFASNIYRLKHIIETCKENKRKVALFGRSMDTSIDIAIKCGYIKDKNIIISAEEANKLEPNKVCLLCTGSQGEPLAALSRIASGTHKQIKLIPNDVVIFSSSPIPGNAASVSKTINKLYLKGVKVYTNGQDNDIHSSGHANQEELKLMIRLFKPTYFAPYHGEYRMLKTHADLACLCDIPKQNTFVLSNGDILNMNKDGIKKQGHVQAEDIYVDGARIGDVSNIIIKDRVLMSNNGILAIIINIDSKNKTLLNTPLVTTRGYILVNESIELIKEIEIFCKKIITNKLKQKTVNFSDIKNELINELMPLLLEKTGRVPIILPIIMDVKR
ncbi:MAG: ribonuclease J [Erysipelotrichaceae bacterium]|nr:ribonuclease J [Erysipelotrichaceae bacterium]MDD6093144.1 ribonuclease J [bacterium]